MHELLAWSTCVASRKPHSIYSPHAVPPPAVARSLALILCRSHLDLILVMATLPVTITKRNITFNESTPGCDTSSRNSISRGCYEERPRFVRPASIHTASGSIARTPRSSDSDFGASCSGPNVPLPPPPPPLTGTPRRPREKTILLDEIGRGGGGTVHKAIHVPSMRLVAVKMVEVHDDEKRHQILRELKTLLSMKPVRFRTPSQASGEKRAEPAY